MTTTFNRKEHATTYIAVKDIAVIWPEAQRIDDEKFSQHIADNMDPDLFGVLTVAVPNGNGIYHCIDGQRRRRGAEIFAGPNEKVPCNVLNITTPAAAANIFYQITTNKTAIQAIDKFKVGVTAGYKMETDIAHLLKTVGYTVGNSYAEGTLRAIGSCVTIYRRYGRKTLQDALVLISKTFGMDPDAVDGKIIRGYGMLLNRSGGEIDFDRLIARVAKKYTPMRLIGAARSMRDVYSGGLANHIARALAHAYNQNLRKGKVLMDD